MGDRFAPSTWKTTGSDCGARRRSIVKYRIVNLFAPAVRNLARLHQSFGGRSRDPLRGLPAVMDPEPLVRMSADRLLHDFAVGLGQGLDGIGPVAERVRTDRIGDDDVVQAPFAIDVGKDNRNVVLQ